MDERDREFLKLFNQLTPEEQNDIINLAGAFASLNQSADPSAVVSVASKA